MKLQKKDEGRGREQTIWGSGGKGTWNPQRWISRNELPLSSKWRSARKSGEKNKTEEGNRATDRRLRQASRGGNKREQVFHDRVGDLPQTREVGVSGSTERGGEACFLGRNGKKEKRGGRYDTTEIWVTRAELRGCQMIKET